LIVAVDYGEKKCGVSYGEVLPRKTIVVPTSKLKEVIAELKPTIVVFGLPISMSGRYSTQTFKVVRSALSFSRKYKVYLCDERMTTKIAKRISKEDDKVSASLIFQTFVQNQGGCWEVCDPRERKSVKEKGNKVLVYEFPDPDVEIEASEVLVVTRNPVLAYFYHERGYFVERELREEKYDLILAGKDCDRLREFLIEGGRLVCL